MAERRASLAVPEESERRLSSSSKGRGRSRSVDSRRATSGLGLLAVRVEQADDLVPPHAGSKPDVRALLTFGVRTYKTHRARKTLSPKWAQELRVFVEAGEIGYVLGISILDKDRFSADDVMGYVEVPVKEWINQPEYAADWREVQLSLQQPKAHSADEKAKEIKTHDDGGLGTLTLRVKWHPLDSCIRAFWHNLHQLFDEDNTGHIDRVELMALLEAIGSTMDDQQVDEALVKSGLATKGNEDDVMLTKEDLQRLMHVAPRKHLERGAWTRCPICDLHLSEDTQRSRTRFIAHVGTCMQEHGGLHYVTASMFNSHYFSTGFWARFGRFLTMGSLHEDGSRPGQVRVRDRATGLVQDEQLPPSWRVAIRVTYHTALGRSAVLRDRARAMLRRMTLRQGKRFDDPASVKYIKQFIKTFNLDVNEVDRDVDQFKTFNEFFSRKLKPDARPVAAPDDDGIVVSPCDCRLSVFTRFDEAARLHVKGNDFTLANLLKDDKLADEFAGAAVAVCRLAPQDYHRAHIPLPGTLLWHRNIEGDYFTVNTMAIRESRMNVFTENHRMISLIETRLAGPVLLIPVGATLVGSITTVAKPGAVDKGDEYAYFQYGGSTVIMLFKQGYVHWDMDLIKSSEQDAIEVLVKAGQRIGRSADPDAEEGAATDNSSSDGELF